MVNSSKASIKNDMLHFNVIKFFGINTRTSKVLRPLHVRWEFPSPGWVKINIDKAARVYPGLDTCGCIFCESMGEFIGVFSTFLEVQTAMVVEPSGVQVLKNPNPLKDVEASTMLDVVVLV